MKPSLLHERAFERLVDDPTIAPRVQNIVLAAFEDKVEEFLAHQVDVAERPKAPQSAKIPGAFLKSLEVQSFRGIGPTTKVQFKCKPGLTLIVGRNGSGKSSLSEALEVALTGNTHRWEGKANSWQAGWRNLHDHGRPTISASFMLDGDAEPIDVKRQWEADAEFEAGKLKVTRAQQEYAGFDEVGWDTAIQTYRPILSYNELGNALNKGPSGLYDSLHGVLGLDDLTAVKSRLTSSRKALEDHKKTFKTAKDSAKALAGASNDERAVAAAKIWAGNKHDIEALYALHEGALEDDSQLASLKMLAALKAPDEGKVLEAVEGLNSAFAASDAVQKAHQDIDPIILNLLREALKFHQSHADATCPVCNTGTLDSPWQVGAQKQLDDAKAYSEAVETAKRQVKQAVAHAQQLIGAAKLRGSASDESVGSAYNTWATQVPDRDLANHLMLQHEPLRVAYEAAANTARVEVQRIETDWRPVRDASQKALGLYEKFLNVEDDIKDLKSAENWIKEFEGILREERFNPIAEKAQQIWRELRNNSNVSISNISLAGTSTHRKVDISVSVDDAETAALGVMSQGELHSMLLSLFLPRATLDESPFRFVVIDDPVQAMDPAKVDGLARVLETTAKTHQVIVLTHDTRLVDAIRRLRIDADVRNVIRQTESRVSVEQGKPAAQQYLDDARDVLENRSKLAPEIAMQVIPGLCRGAFESAFKDLAWNKMLAEGVTHDVCEEHIRGCRNTTNIAQLAMVGVGGQGNLYSILNNKYKGSFVDVLKITIEHSHKAYRGDLEALLNDTRTALRMMGAL
jgi:recombinational DNA repair ATPase RecF